MGLWKVLLLGLHKIKTNLGALQEMTITQTVFALMIFMTMLFPIILYLGYKVLIALLEKYNSKRRYNSNIP